MNVGACFGLLGIWYSVLYLADTLLRSWAPHQYSRVLRWTGIEIGLFQVRWFTERFNRSLIRYGRSCPRLLSAWFLIGAIISSLLIIPSIYFLVVNLVGQFSQDNGENRVVIQPVLPGVNIPNSELGYYFFSLLLCSVYHEIGHAIAAVSENVRVLGFGVFVLFIIPAAYVDLPTDQLLSKTSLQKLRVFSAGVWHNIILVCVSYLMIQCIPFVSDPLYSHGLHPCIVHVTPESSVTGPSGLKPGDAILSVSGTTVLNKSDFRKHIVKLLQEPNLGFCINVQSLPISSSSKTSNIPTFKETNNLECCDNSTNSLCFDTGVYGAQCLHVRELLMTVNKTCSGPSDCDKDDLCATPVFSANGTKFVQIQRLNHKDFLFVGNPALIYTSIQLSDYCPRHWSLPLSLPEVALKLCNYIVSFSAALAVLNVIPSVMLDGQHMMKVLLELMLQGDYARYREIIQIILTLSGTTLVLSNIGFGFYTLLTTGGNMF